MAIPLDVYKWRRVVMVRFKRAVTGDPVIDNPDMDDRGYTGADHGPIVGICQGDTVTVRLSRELIESSAKLYVKSTDTSVVTVASPALGKLPDRRDMDFQLQGVAGGNPKSAKIQVLYGSNVGRVIHELSVWVFTLITVRITPHMTTIGQTGAAGGGIGTIADLNAIMDLVRAIWRPCGVAFTVGAVRNEAVSFAAAGVVSDAAWDNTHQAQNTELNTLLSTNSIPNTINVYFVNQIGTGNTLGYGFSRSSSATFMLNNPGIILADQTARGGRSGVMHWANDLGHEIGHFFGLWHPEQLQPPNEREDTWSRRMLMHNFNLMRRHNPWPAVDGDGHSYAHRPLLDDVGYDDIRRGCFVTMKHFAQLTTDGECPTARATITSAAGPY
jgi:hypothetical protein